MIRAVNAKAHPVVFILWGSHARRKKALIDPRHTVIESAHPSPLSAHNGFFGSKPFSRANAALERGARADRLASRPLTDVGREACLQWRREAGRHAHAVEPGRQLIGRRGDQRRRLGALTGRSSSVTTRPSSSCAQPPTAAPSTRTIGPALPLRSNSCGTEAVEDPARAASTP